MHGGLLSSPYAQLMEGRGRAALTWPRTRQRTQAMPHGQTVALLWHCLRQANRLGVAGQPRGGRGSFLVTTDGVPCPAHSISAKPSMS